MIMMIWLLLNHFYEPFLISAPEYDDDNERLSHKILYYYLEQYVLFHFSIIPLFHYYHENLLILMFVIMTATTNDDFANFWFLQKYIHDNINVPLIFRYYGSWRWIIIIIILYCPNFLLSLDVVIWQWCSIYFLLIIYKHTKTLCQKLVRPIFLYLLLLFSRCWFTRQQYPWSEEILITSSN